MLRRAQVVMAVVLAGCAGKTPPSPGAVAAAPTAALPAGQPWPEAADCRALVTAVLAMPEAERARLRPEDSPIALAVMDGPLPVRVREVPSAIDLDLPVPAVLATAPARCLVVAERPRLLPGSGRRLVGHETVNSEYRSGSRRENSDARSQADDEPAGTMLQTGNPMLDLLGFAAGAVARGVGSLRSGKDATRLASSERDADDTDYTPYTYEISTFAIDRAGTLGLTLIDRPADRAYEAQHTVREHQSLAVAKGRHPADRGLLDGTGPEAVLPEDAALVEATPPRPRLSELLRVLAESAEEGRPATDVLAQIGHRPPVSLPAGKPEGAGERVTVETLDGPAEGTWLDPEHIALPSSALGRSSLVQLSRADGTRVFGLVERVDAATGRAVVRVGQLRSGTDR